MAAHFVWAIMLDAAFTEYLSIPDLLKATPSEENGHRYIYLEASNQTMDQQGEVVLAKALSDSASYFLKFGNFDLDHITQIGPKRGIRDYALYEIGRPIKVKVDGGQTMVKGEIYAGDGPVAANANIFWDSLTRIRPAQRWYPSVGGAVLERDDKAVPAVVKRVRWTNIGFSKTPVNQDVPTVSTVPFGVLQKSWGVAGLDLAMSKTLTAGYGTDVATLEGGGALRKQSLDHRVQSYWDIRDKLAGDIRKNVVKAHPAALVDHTHQTYGVDKAEAAEWVERFLADLKDGRSKRVKQ